MKKRLKVVLSLILLLVIGVVLYLSFGGGRRNDNIEVPSTPDVDLDVAEPTEPIKLEEEEGDFEEDVMKDLEGFFNNTNGYENIEGEYGFTDAELE